MEYRSIRSLNPDQIKKKLELVQPGPKMYSKWRSKLKRRTFQQYLIRTGLLGLNILILLIIFIFVIQKPSATASSTSSLTSLNAVATQSPNPLDQLASANIALTVAQMSNLPETTAINNQADTQQAELAMASTANNIIAKPEITQTSLKSRANIISYTVEPGDTLSSIAAKFGVSNDSITWSNNLNSGAVIPGQTLLIPPVSGIVYTVKAGDTPASLAQQFHADEARLIAYNDAKIDGIYPGEEIVIPGGTEPTPTVATAEYLPSYGSNGYEYGYCTWYVASVIAVPNNWGNAATWAYYASLSGWNVSSTPKIGAIAQTPYAAGGQGHVAIVVGVNGNSVEIKDMNGLAGWGAVGEGWVPASTFPNYITH
ncbi:MAG: CHAP domain-containing protein [Candidatus Saccharimonadales bacterium]